MLPDWSSLNLELLDLISASLPSAVDYARFRSVCTAWRSAAPRRPHLPWLYYLSKTHDSRHLLSHFPDPDPRRAPPLPHSPHRTSSRGWLACLTSPASPSLHNPFTGARIHLPQLTLPGPARAKTVLSANPTSQPRYEVMALCGRRLFHCRPASGAWSEFPTVHNTPDCFTDVTFYNGKFYAVWGYRVFVCDVGLDARITEILPRRMLFSDGELRDVEVGVESYLAVCSGDLLLVVITDLGCDCGDGDCESCQACKCEVFRVDLVLCWDEIRWELRLFKMENLRGRALFLCSESTSVSVGNSRWCRGNSIYFIRSIGREGEKVVVYSMEDENVSFIRMNCRPYCWLTPSLCYHARKLALNDSIAVHTQPCYLNQKSLAHLIHL